MKFDTKFLKKVGKPKDSEQISFRFVFLIRAMFNFKLDQMHHLVFDINKKLSKITFAFLNGIFHSHVSDIDVVTQSRQGVTP